MRAERLYRLAEALRQRCWTVDEIASRWKVSHRTAFRDLADLREQFQCVVVCEDGKYSILKEGSRWRLEVDGEELLLLRLALENAALRSRLALLPKLKELEGKLLSAGQASQAPFSLKALDRTGFRADGVFEELAAAIAARKACRVTYHSLSSGRREKRELEPLQLFQRAEAWYLAANSPEHGEVRIYRLDRFDADLEVLERTFEPPADFDLEGFLESSWELVHGRDRYQIHVRFAPELAPLLLRARHHPKEQVSQAADGWMDYRLALSHLEEFARWLAGFGGKARVLAPEELRQLLLELARSTIQSNDDVSSPGSAANVADPAKPRSRRRRKSVEERS